MVVVRAAGPQANLPVPVRGGVPRRSRPRDRARGATRSVDRPRRRCAESMVRGPCFTSKARRRGWPCLQTQNGASRHSPCVPRAATGWFLLRIPYSQPILDQRLVVNLLESGKLSQQMAGEPEEALGLADLAQRNLEIADTPRGSRAHAGPRAILSPGALGGRLADGAGPEIVEDRVGNCSAQNPPHAVAERGEETFVMDCQVLVRRLAGPLIEFNPDGVADSHPRVGNADRGRLG